MCSSDQKGAAAARTMEDDCAVIVFVKEPKPGFCKTRLIPAVGAEQAARISRQMTEHCMRRLDQCHPNVAIFVEYASVQEEENFFESWLRPFLSGQRRVHFGSQVESKDLGERMQRSFEKVFDTSNCGQVVIVGTDAPDIHASLIEQALLSLRLGKADVVLGPAMDGGYYLLGLRSVHPSLFTGILWSTDSVLQCTLERASKLQLHVLQLETLADVDTEEDLHVWHRVQDSQI